MVLNLLRKYHYFIVYTTNTLGNGDALDPKVIKFVKKYFWWRGRKSEYFEPFTDKTNLTTMVIFGTSSNKQKTVKRNILIFLLELYAQLKDPNFVVSEDFEASHKEVNGHNLLIYKVKI